MRLGRLCLSIQICQPDAHPAAGIRGLNVEVGAYWGAISMGWGLAHRLKVIQGDQVTEL